MRLVIQRVKHAKMSVNEKIVGQINHGFLIYVGIHIEDTEQEVIKFAHKVHQLRVFEDQEGKMNLDISKVNGEILAISQFTLYGDTKRGNRPSFIEAARPEQANQLYELFCQELNHKIHVEKGVFGSHMMIESINDGPVTILMDSRKES